jgi:hypothetical protein
MLRQTTKEEEVLDRTADVAATIAEEGLRYVSDSSPGYPGRLWLVTEEESNRISLPLHAPSRSKEHELIRPVSALSALRSIAAWEPDDVRKSCRDFGRCVTGEPCAIAVVRC